MRACTMQGTSSFAKTWTCVKWINSRKALSTDSGPRLLPQLEIHDLSGWSVSARWSLEVPRSLILT